MNLRDLLYVKTICDTGSFRQAAQSLGVSQPTLSTAIARLEDRLGATLFERSKGRSQPTHLAKFIARRADGILENAETLTREIADVVKGEYGVVRIGLGPAVARRVVVDLLFALKHERPNLSVETTVYTITYLLDALNAGELDFVVCDAAASGSRSALISETLFDNEFVIVAHPDHPVFAQKELSLRELVSYPLALPPIPPDYLRVLNEQYGVDLERVQDRVVCADLEVLSRIAQKGLHVVAGPRIGFVDELREGTLRQFPHQFPFRHRVVLMRAANAYPSAVIEHALDVTRNVCRDFAKTLK